MPSTSTITRFLALLAFVLLGKTSFAQDDSLSFVTPKKSYLKVSASYLTNAVYNGRKDSTTTPYLTGLIGYYHKSGLSLSGSFSYQPNTGIVEVFSIDAGYSVDITKKLSLSVDGNKGFYNSSSTAVQSGIKGSLGGDLSYSPGIITIDGGVNAIFSDKTDIMVNGLLSHEFSIDGFDDDSEFTITPGFSGNFGTQNFYQNYKARVAKKKAVSASSSSVSGSNNFGVLDYEISLPVGYDAKRWGVSINPVFAIPQNPINTTTTNTVTVLTRTFNTTTNDTEKLQNVFYAQFTVYIKF